MSLPQQQFFAHHNGHLYMIANPNTIPYYLPPRINPIGQQPALPQPHAESPQQHQPQPQLQSPQQIQQIQHQIQQQPKPKSKHQTNIKLRAIKEKCVSHYIEGQLIIETLKPLTDRKKKRKLQPATPQINHQSQSQTQPKPKPQPQQPQPHPIQHIQHPQIQQLPQLPQVLTPPQPSKVQVQVQVKPEPQSVEKLRANMYNWSVGEVVKFIEKHEDIREYSSKFAEDEIDGKALLLIIDRNPSFQALTPMFKHGPAIKIDATLSKYKLNDK